jgi:ubiquinone biosynthesis monooxygenase Coq7
MSFGLGALAGLAGDKWSLGFVAETEKQVCEHLQEHLAALPQQDGKSRHILEEMLVDEARHASTAMEAGAAELPQPLKQGMALMAKVMKTTVYRI